MSSGNQAMFSNAQMERENARIALTTSMGADGQPSQEALARWEEATRNFQIIDTAMRIQYVPGVREAIESGQAGFAPWLQEGLERIGALAGIGGNYSMPTA